MSGETLTVVEREASPDHYHEDSKGVLHACYHKCPSWLKIMVVSGAMNLFWEFATFLPVHRFYEHMHWIH